MRRSSGIPNKINLAVQYADEDLRRELEAAEAQIQNRIREKREADARKAEEERLEAERKAEAESRRKEQERLEKERAEREAREEEERRRKREEQVKKQKLAIRASIAVDFAILACYAVFYTLVIKPASKYNDATALLQRNKYAEAYSQFEDLAAENYKDSSQMMDKVYQECIFDAKELLQAGDYKSALSALESMEKYISNYDTGEFYKTKYQAWQEQSVDSLQNATIGGTVFIGQFEQDSNTYNETEPIEWKVLDIQDGKAFLLSDKILTYKEYNEEVEGYVFEYEEKEFVWESSYIRNWLNAEFYDAAFSEDDKSRIIKTEYKSKGGRHYEPEKVSYTSENVTLLSDEEVRTYLGEGESAKAKDTQFAYDNKGSWAFDGR